MKKFIIAPLLMLNLGCHTVGDALNPVTSNSNYNETKNAKGETVTEHTRTTLMPNYLTANNHYNDPIVPSTPAPQNGSENVQITYKNLEEQNLEKSRPSNDFRVLGFAELSQSKNSTHFGIHIGGEPSPYILMRLGLSIFSSSDFYMGLDASARAQIPLDKFKPFVGVGGYLGDTEKCYQINSTTEHCDKKFLGAGYGEIGFEVSQFSLFYRKYNLNRAGISIPDQDFIGIGVRLTSGQ